MRPAVLLRIICLIWAPPLASNNMNTTTNNTASREMPYHVGETQLPGERPNAASRAAMVEALRVNAMKIVKEHNAVVVSAGGVLQSLKGLGLLPHVKKANGVGDVLGAKGLNLPFASRDGKRVYLLPAIGWDDKELEAFTELGPEEQVARVRELDKELLGIDHDGAESSGPEEEPELTAPNAATAAEEE